MTSYVTVRALLRAAVFAMNTKSEKQREYSDPDTYAMDGDHQIESRKDTGTCSCYVVDTYK